MTEELDDIELMDEMDEVGEPSADGQLYEHLRMEVDRGQESVRIDKFMSEALRAKRELPGSMKAARRVVTVPKEVAEVSRVRLPLILPEIRPGLKGGKKIIRKASTITIRWIHSAARSPAR